MISLCLASTKQVKTSRRLVCKYSYTLFQPSFEMYFAQMYQLAITILPMSAVAVDSSAENCVSSDRMCWEFGLFLVTNCNQETCLHQVKQDINLKESASRRTDTRFFSNRKSTFQPSQHQTNDDGNTRKYEERKVGSRQVTLSFWELRSRQTKPEVHKALLLKYMCNEANHWLEMKL